MSSADAKDAIRSAVDIVELVGEYIPLRRQGTRFVGLCPWHDDSRPSLQVSPDRQSYRCFVCNEGGDVFSFLMKMEGVEFREALHMLSERTGIPLSTPGTSPRGEVANSKDALYRALHWAERQYHDFLLNDPSAAIARHYLDKRGISAASIEQFQLGFAPNRWDWLLKRGQAKNVPIEVLERAGLVAARSSGPGHYDRFKGRLLFSIRDPQGRTVGFGGRMLPGIEYSNPAKYINSPETPLFSKSALLYGLDRARDAVSRNRAVVVVEGYTDCIMAHQLGLHDVVAVLGTALGPRHVKLLRRYADRITLVLDGDEAGRRRANEILELFVAEQIDLRILTLPENADPCDYLRSHGAERFAAMASETVDALEHKFRTLATNLDAENTHDVQRAVESVLGTLAKAPRLPNTEISAARLKEDQILHRMARRFGITEERLRERLAALRKPTRRSANSTKPETATKIPSWEQELVELLILEPGTLAAIRDVVTPEQLSGQSHREVFETFCRLADDGIVPTFERLLSELDDPALKRLIVELDEMGRAKGHSDIDVRLGALIESYRRRQADAQLRGATAALKSQQLDVDSGTQLFEELVQSQRNRQSISAPTDG